MAESSYGIYLARSAVRHKAQGKSPEYLANQVGQARWWEREAGLLDYGPSAKEEADEWERIAELVRAEGLAAYDAAHDEQAQVWDAEYRDLVAAQQEGTQRLRRTRRVEAGQQLAVELSAKAEQRLVALAAGLGVSAERVLEVLAENVESTGEGLVRVPGVRVSPSP
ncbi:hypothetical protein [Kitasatospora sp. NBC_01302]|uniref:hypothetical protein n=1 Tax=Kitasatospora sp. NBC_01302 TaxID=2903575 RepID=UPI002E13E2F9|nr:hypothetical protein OG294_00005 [Kitasatospora sp. NBC_01302]WSJ71717.1 hypothetical protein OG294_39655 [Kitasatospora sp. NBC_01302]WSJ72331.1 hypothetical protein OG294_40290 [Kitasatospora sp. NBC_01302]